MGVEIETNFSKRLPEDHRLPRAERFIRDHFSGTNILDIILDAGEPSALLDPAVFAKTRAVQQNLATVPGVDTAFSAVNLIERMHRELAPEEAARASLPGSRELLAQYQLLFEMSGGEGFQRLINDENRRMRIALRLQGSGFRESAEIGRAAVAAANQAGGPVLKAEPAGLTYLFGGWLDFIVAGQRQGLAFSIVTIALVMAWGLRSFAAGMWSMVPNLIPLMFLGGYVATRYGQVDSDTLIVAIMAIGIAVDDTIHILTRLQFERQRHENLEDALKRAYLFCGRGMVMTTVILSLGFSPFYFSDYYSTQILGTLLPLTLIVALVADLLLTPAMAAAKIINIKGKSINSQAGPEKEPLR